MRHHDSNQPLVGAGLCACPIAVPVFVTAGKHGSLPLQNYLRKLNRYWTSANIALADKSSA